MQIPSFLRHLDRDRRGIPVPYINLWGDPDDRARISIWSDVNVGGAPAVFYNDDKHAGPNFFAQSFQRQRECVGRGLCQVCGRPVPWPDRLLVVGTVSTQYAQFGTQRRLVVSEPWLDPDCAAFATAKCPGLIRRRSADDLILATGLSPRRCELFCSSGWIDGPLEAATRRNPVIMWGKIAIADSPQLITAKMVRTQTTAG